jgi:polygalacturonase
MQSFDPEFFLLQPDGHQRAIDILFAPRSEAAFASAPFRMIRTAFVPGCPVTLVRAAGWESVAIHSLAGAVPVHVAGTQLSFVPPQSGSYSFYQGTEALVHLFVEAPAADKPSPNAWKVTEHGVFPDSPAVQTVAIQTVLDHVAAAGGGTVYFPAGRYLTGSLFASGNTRIHLDPDCLLQGSRCSQDYLRHAAAVASGRLAQPNPVARAALLTFSGGKGGGLVGGGTLDGNGHRLREDLVTGAVDRHELNLVAAIGCEDFVLRDVFLRDSEFWNTHLYQCRNVRICRVKVINEIPHRNWNPKVQNIFWNNADGINSDTCQNVEITDSFFHTGDDCLTLKLTGPFDGPSVELTDIVMRGCTLRSSTSAMKIGTETRGEQVNGVVFEEMLVLPDHTGSVATLSVFDFAHVRNVLYRRIRSEARTRFIDITVRPRRVGQTRFGSIRNLRFEDVQLRGTGACVFYGQSAENDIREVQMVRVVSDGQPVRSLADLNLTEAPHVNNLTFE